MGEITYETILNQMEHSREFCLGIQSQTRQRRQRVLYISLLRIGARSAPRQRRDFRLQKKNVFVLWRLKKRSDMLGFAYNNSTKITTHGSKLIIAATTTTSAFTCVALFVRPVFLFIADPGFHRCFLFDITAEGRARRRQLQREVFHTSQLLFGFVI